MTKRDGYQGVGDISKAGPFPHGGSGVRPPRSQIAPKVLPGDYGAPSVRVEMPDVMPPRIKEAKGAKRKHSS